MISILLTALLKAMTVSERSCAYYLVRGGVALSHCRRQWRAVALGSLASARRLNSRAAKDAPTAGLQTGVDTGWPKTERCERRLPLRYSTKTGSGQTWEKLQQRGVLCRAAGRRDTTLRQVHTQARPERIAAATPTHPVRHASMQTLPSRWSRTALSASRVLACQRPSSCWPTLGTATTTPAERAIAMSATSARRSR